jgi:hypothetical protein
MQGLVQELVQELVQGGQQQGLMQELLPAFPGHIWATVHMEVAQCSVAGGN